MGVEACEAVHAMLLPRLVCKEFCIRGPCDFFLANVKEHAPLSARASVDHGVDVETTDEHVNRAADRGCSVSSCSLLQFVVLSGHAGHQSLPSRQRLDGSQVIWSESTEETVPFRTELRTAGSISLNDSAFTPRRAPKWLLWMSILLESFSPDSKIHVVTLTAHSPRVYETVALASACRYASSCPCRPPLRSDLRTWLQVKAMTQTG